jgi:hypothetical protein
VQNDLPTSKEPGGVPALVALARILGSNRQTRHHIPLAERIDGHERWTVVSGSLLYLQDISLIARTGVTPSAATNVRMYFTAGGDAPSSHEVTDFTSRVAQHKSYQAIRHLFLP